jgi:hypothetical protein
MAVADGEATPGVAVSEARLAFRDTTPGATLTADVYLEWVTSF